MSNEISSTFYMRPLNLKEVLNFRLFRCIFYSLFVGFALICLIVVLKYLVYNFFSLKNLQRFLFIKFLNIFNIHKWHINEGKGEQERVKIRLSLYKNCTKKKNNASILKHFKKEYITKIMKKWKYIYI